ncbi:MAG: hypothetical protein LBE14_08240 [Treponema sp.]|nr:hypothetical protein [Treponema sp.]
MMKPITVILAGFVIFFNISCITIDPKKLYPDMVADVDPVSVGIIDAEFDRPFSANLDKKEVEVTFLPRYNAVAFDFRYQLTNYRQIWGREGRDLFVKAVETYKADYAAKNLGRKFSKTRRAYGKFKGKLEWSYSKHSESNTSFPVIELGYSFQGEKGKETPFFTVTQKSAREESSPQGNNNKLDSIPIKMFFTREQADELVRVINQESLMSSLVFSPDYDKPKDEDYGEAAF